MEINGLPLHVLVVHAAVVFGPLSALSGIAYVAFPSWRDRLRWVTLVLVLIATGAIWTAALSGENFLETADRFKGLQGEAAEKIHDHEELGEMLRNVVTGYAIVTILATWQHRREGALRYLLGGLVVVGAIATLVYTILTGDAGARAVWGE
jgi:cytochrome c biogenesis protein CcdA